MGHPTGALITFVIMPFMKTKLRMIGSGFGVLLPKKVIDNLRLSVGDELELVEQEWGIELSPFDPDFADQVEAFRRTEEASLRDLTPLLSIPEFKVPLPGGVRPSQNDLFVLARGTNGLVSIMVEGKVRESFGPTLGEWRGAASPGKKSRLQFLLQIGRAHV